MEVGVCFDICNKSQTRCCCEGMRSCHNGMNLIRQPDPCMPNPACACRVKRTLMLTVVRIYAVNSSASTQHNVQLAHLRFAAA